MLQSKCIAIFYKISVLLTFYIISVPVYADCGSCGSPQTNAGRLCWATCDSNVSQNYNLWSTDDTSTQIYELVRDLAESGDVEAQFNLAVMYENGIYTEQNHAVALMWYRMAAKNGHAVSKNVVRAVESYTDNDVEFENFDEIMSQNEKEISKHTKTGLAHLYSLDPGSDEKALPLFRKACEKGDVMACHEIAYMSVSGRVIEDVSFGISEYKRLCNLNVGKSCTNLGYHYSSGKHVEKDIIKGHDLSRKGCSLGSMEGCAAVSFNIANDVVTKQSDKYAFELMQKACKTGFAKGCSNLGFFYEHGFYATRNIQQARSYFKKACDMNEAYDRGNEVGCENFGRLLLQDGNRDAAANYFKKGCNGGNLYGKHLRMDRSCRFLDDLKE